MLLYHLMTDEGTLPDKVIPQVPQNLMQGEDQSVPRICVGQSLDDCLTGITVTGITIPFLLAEVKRAGAQRLEETVHGKQETPWQKIEQPKPERLIPWWYDL